MNIIQLRTKFIKRIILAFSRRKPIEKRELAEQFVIYYRISDAGYPKTKPAYISNENCLRNAVKEFPVGTANRWVVIADNCSDATIDMIKKYIPSECIDRRSVGHGAGTFKLTLDMAMELPSRTPIYFLENDYLHRPGSRVALLDGLSISPYATLYDHPDKYQAQDGTRFWSRCTPVVMGQVCHWRDARSTTMTFASTPKVLREDRKIFERWLQTKHPYDFEIFLDINCKGRKLISPIPSYSTHGETAFLAPFINWQEVENTL